MRLALERSEAVKTGLLTDLEDTILMSEGHSQRPARVEQDRRERDRRGPPRRRRRWLAQMPVRSERRIVVCRGSRIDQVWVSNRVPEVVREEVVRVFALRAVKGVYVIGINRVGSPFAFPQDLGRATFADAEEAALEAQRMGLRVNRLVMLAFSKTYSSSDIRFVQLLHIIDDSGAQHSGPQPTVPTE